MNRPGEFSLEALADFPGDAMTAEGLIDAAQVRSASSIESLLIAFSSAARFVISYLITIGRKMSFGGGGAL